MEAHKLQPASQFKDLFYNSNQQMQPKDQILLHNKFDLDNDNKRAKTA